MKKTSPHIKNTSNSNTFFFILKEVFEINSILVSKFVYIIQDIDRLCLLFYNPRWQKTTKRSLRGIATFWQRMRYNNMNPTSI